MEIKPAKPQHVVAIPYPAQGHINPMLQLCEQLIPRGFSFTFINTQHIHLRLLHTVGHAHPARDGEHHVQDDPHHDNAHRNEDDALDADANDANHCEDTHVLHAHDGDDAGAHEVHHYKGCSSIRMVFVAGGCAPEQHAHESTAPEAFKAAQEMCEPVEHLISRIIMSDILLSWSSATAQKFGLPWVSFWPASTASLSALIHFSDLISQGQASIPIFAEMEGEEAPLIEGIPGLPPTRICDVPKLWDGQGKLYDAGGRFLKPMEQAACVVLNTFAEVEGQVLEALSKRFPIHAVGPLLPARYMLPTCPDSDNIPDTRPSLFPEDSSCLAWLDKQAPSSVLFISFGSISLRSREQLQELAKGVEASGCPFLWVRKPDIENVPDKHIGFFTHEEDGHPNGLIVPWAPQLQVLSHPSVGGFLTHCGWNSVIESVSMGVPMLCWADMGERMSNQRFVVDFWKCGIDMVADARRAKQHIDDEAMLVGRDDVEKSIRFLMLEEGGASVRVRATKLRDAAIKAYQDSHAQLDEFARTMKHHFIDYSR